MSIVATHCYVSPTPHSFWPDRLLLAGLGLLTIYRPAFMGAFLLVAYMLTGQYNEPLQFSWTDKLVIYQLGVVIFLFLAVRSVLGRRMTQNAPFILMCAVLAQWYFVPAIGKLELAGFGKTTLPICWRLPGIRTVGLFATGSQGT